MTTSQIRIVFDRASEAAAPAEPTAVIQLAEADRAVPAIGPSPKDIRLYGPLGRTAPVPLIDPARVNPDPRLLDEFTATRALAEGIWPLRKLGTTLIVAVADPALVPRLPRVTGHEGLFLPYHAPDFEDLLLARCGPALAAAAETRVPSRESCRAWSARPHMFFLAVISALAILAIIQAPEAVLIALVGWGLVWMIASSVLKILVLASVRARAAEAARPAIALVPLHPPIVTLLIALYREGDIAHRLVTRLSRLDYPPDRLDVILAVEDDDAVTRAALKTVDLPRWMRLVTVPEGTLRTKPRALNHAMALARGSIIGVYDAEDAPDPGQLRDVVARFEAAPPEVACLQGMLDFYNPRSNWLSRCFTVEYAAWFRVMLPGLARLGLVLPLGGTTLFFRRDALEGLGGWDAHNVTEDADLGLRLARHGYRTELITTVTEEEANCRLLPWIRQRSRWIKGYMMTWAVHMRNPALLMRQLGWKRFIGVQVLFLGSISQALLVPVMWSLWAFALGFGHPALEIVSPALFLPITLMLLAMEAVTISINLYGMALRGKGVKPLWVLSSYFYFPLAAFAAYKALYEVFAKPFYWDKTTHGHFDLG